MKLVFLIKSEISQGIKVEAEHKNTISKIRKNPKMKDKIIQEYIAKDHIKEAKDKGYQYYVRLLAAEKLEDYTGIEKKIIEFMKKHKGNIKDERDIHSLADKLKINKHTFEEKIYNMFKKIVGGK